MTATEVVLEEATNKRLKKSDRKKVRNREGTSASRHKAEGGKIGKVLLSVKRKGRENEVCRRLKERGRKGKS